MKAKNTLIISALLASAIMTFTFSCSKDVEIEKPSSAGHTFTSTFEAQGGKNTKTYLHDDLSVYWSDGDKIRVYSSNNPGGIEFTLKSGANSNNASFSSNEWAEDNGHKYAIYPNANGIDLVNGEFSISFPAIQDYIPNTYDQKANFSVAYTESGDNLSFKNVCGLLKLNITGMVKIKQIAVSEYDILNSDSHILNGEAKIKYLPNLSTPVIVFNNSESSTPRTPEECTATLDCSKDGGVQLNSTTPTSFFFVIPPGAFENALEVKITDVNDQIYTQRTTKNNKIERSTITNMPAFELISRIPASKMANCIILPAEGKYELDVSYKGGSTMDGDMITPTDIAMVWNDPHLVINCTYDPTNKIVSLTYSHSEQKDGNALIAAKDVSGNILWSWHLWCTTGVPQTVVDDYIMDRNLGATSTDGADSHGLFYQWGRKDPFKSSQSAVSVSSTGSSPLDYSIKHPDKFIKGDDNSTNDWYSTTQSGMNNYLWSTNTGTSSGVEGKSIYDPCPYGWQIPATGSYANFSYENVPNAIPPFSSGYYFFYQGTSGEKKTWYPASGYLSYDNGIINGENTHGYYWMSSYEMLENDYGPAFRFSTNEATSGNFFRAYGFNVRCVKQHD